MERQEAKRKSVSKGGCFQDLRKGNSEGLPEKKRGARGETQGELFMLSLEVKNCRVGQ